MRGRPGCRCAGTCPACVAHRRAHQGAWWLGMLGFALSGPAALAASAQALDVARAVPPTEAQLANYRCGPIHLWFELTYSSYLVIPRLALQELPVDWQARFVALLEEAEHVHDMKTPGGYVVQRRIGGRFRRDPWANYRHGSVAKARAKDER